MAFPFPMFGIGFGVLILLPIIWFIISILISIWTYRDAESRGEEGILWLIIVLFTGIIGLVIWLIVRPSRTTVEKRRRQGKVRYCPNCGAEINPGANFCNECGEELSTG